MKMKKAVSPLIAIVLIIGITFALFIVLNAWGGEFMLSRQKESESKISSALDCALGSVEIKHAVYNASAGKLYVLVRNSGQVDFSRVKIAVLVGDEVKVFNATSPTSSSDLPKGSERVYVIHVPNACEMQIIRVSTECTGVKDTLKRSEIVFYNC